MRLATEADAHLPTYDYSALAAINTCPAWGSMLYGLRKKMPGAGRAMALEVGQACHDVFAAVRLFQLYQHQRLPHTALYHGKRLFGASRWEKLHPFLEAGKNTLHDTCKNLALETLYTSGFHDDPQDKRRTLSNIEEACLAYIDRWDFESNPIWVRDALDPQSDVGIEIPFELVIEFIIDQPEYGPSFEKTVKYKFIGKIDGVHVDRNNIRIEENKTASRLNDAWLLEKEMSHQITGYMCAGSVFTGEAVDRAMVHGLSIPLPRSYDFGGIVRAPVRRHPHQFSQFFEWFLHSAQMFERFPDPATAPKYTHSCNRYFRPCNMIPFCTGDDEEKARIIEEMVHNDWTPLDAKATD